jgi:flagellar hook-associated protein FlgK
MAEMSNFLENALINGTLRATNYTAPTTVYVGLYTSDPTDANTGTQVSGGSYARTAVTFAAPSNGVTTNNAAVEFPQATADWGTVGWIGILDASTNGNLLYHTPLDISKVISSGDVFKIAVGSLSVTLA